jgi:hypothetical protein
MTDDAELHFVETTPTGAPSEPDGGDVITGRTPRPPLRWSLRPSWLAGLLLVALAAGLCIGYAVHGDKRITTTGPSGFPSTSGSPAGSVLAEFPSLQATGNMCSGQPDQSHRLMVGVEITNGAPRPIVLSDVKGVFPLGGLRVVDTQVGACDNTSTQHVAGHLFEPSATVWISLTLDVLVRCPGPLPVSFQVDYTIDGAAGTQEVHGFSDLGNVPYPGCPTR